MTLIIDPQFTVEEVRVVLQQLGKVRHVAAGVYRLEPHRLPTRAELLRMAEMARTTGA